MKTSLISLIALFFAISSPINESNYSREKHMITSKSTFDVNTTTDKLVNIIESKGLNLFSKIDHAAGAQKADLELKPTTLLIFGNPKVGTLLMQCDQRMGYELPLKILVWENEDGDTLVGYNDPMVFGHHYDLGDCQQILTNVKGALAGIVKEALK